MATEKNVIEQYAEAEYRPGVSPGAAARQLCSLLGSSNAAPTLQRLLEHMLADANRASFDRSRILSDFRDADPTAAREAEKRSFVRNNRDPLDAPPRATLRQD